MIEGLDQFWPLLDAEKPRYFRGAFEQWPDGLWEQLKRIGWLIPVGESATVRCPECRDHIEEIIARPYPAGTRFFIQCPELIRVEITPEDREIWGIDQQMMAQWIAQQLGLLGPIRSLTSNRVWSCGQLHWYGLDREIVFATGLRHHPWPQSFNPPLLHPIVLVPKAIPAETANPQPTVVSLSRIVHLDEHGVHLDQDALESLILGSESKAAIADFVFLLRGDFWQVTYQGTTQYLKDSVGMGYLARILAQPFQDIPASTLLAARAGIDPRVTQGSSEPLIDDVALKQLRTRYQELESEIADAEACHDLGRLENAHTERQQLIDELTRSTGLGGKLRERSDADRVRKSVSAAVTREITNITKHHKSLGLHLQQTVNSGFTFRYSPEMPIRWLT